MTTKKLLCYFRIAALFRSVSLKAQKMARLFIFFSLSLFLPAIALCQVDTGSISGTVRDTGGSVIPGVNVTLTNQGTGQSISTTTKSVGEYTFSPVRIGHYSVSAEMTGFEKTQQNNVTVDVQQKVQVDLLMTLGKTNETVTVDAAPPALQTQDASVGQVIGQEAINGLPLNGRNYTFLAQLAAGVNQGQQDTRGLGSSGAFSANGLRPAQNNYLLDGIDNNSNLVDFLNGTNYAIRPPVDAIQEFKVATNDYSADTGRSAGAVLNATIKSGTNQFHGAAWEFFRNDALDAANYFENANGLPKGRFQQNQFGATLGGPIIHNKTFFFVDYEGTRANQAIPYTSTVPTSTEVSSGFTNFSELLGQGGTVTDILGRSFALRAGWKPIQSPWQNSILPQTTRDSSITMDRIRFRLIPSTRRMFAWTTRSATKTIFSGASVMWTILNSFPVRSAGLQTEDHFLPETNKPPPTARHWVRRICFRRLL